MIYRLSADQKKTHPPTYPNRVRVGSGQVKKKYFNHDLEHSDITPYCFQFRLAVNEQASRL